MPNYSGALRTPCLTAVIFILTVLAGASPHLPVPQSDDAQVAARIERVENGIPPISLGASEPPLHVPARRRENTLGPRRAMAHPGA
jgi:hypothetical protein